MGGGMCALCQQTACHECRRKSAVRASSGASVGCSAEAIAGGGQAPMAGRVLDSSLQRSLDGLLEEDPDLCCPVSLLIFAEPVRASDGFIYEKSMLMQLLQNRQRSPMTREVLKSEFRVATEKMADALEFRHGRSEHLIKFALQAATPQPQMATTALERVVDYLAVLQTEPARHLAAEAAKVYITLGQRVPAGLRHVSSRQDTCVHTYSNQSLIGVQSDITEL